MTYTSQKLSNERQKMKKSRIFFSSLLVIFISAFLTACSSKNTKNKTTLPSAKTILVGAQKTDLKNLIATWTQKNANNKIAQTANVKYQQKPLLMNITATNNSNHYKMWITNKTNYIQMTGTASDKWFKTKLTDTSNYAQLADSIAKNALLSFDDSTAKLFKVKQNNSGYSLSYIGTNKKIWQTVQQSSSITSMIGIDFSSAKPNNIDIKINTDKNYKLTKLQVSVKYTEEKKVKTFKMTIDQINQLGKLTLPSKVTKNAINLEKIK